MSETENAAAATGKGDARAAPGPICRRCGLPYGHCVDQYLSAALERLTAADRVPEHRIESALPWLKDAMAQEHGLCCASCAQ